MPEQCEQDDDGKWNAEQPKQCATTKAHVSLHLSPCSEQRDAENVPLRQEIGMFVFFSNRVGVFGSIAISVLITLVLLKACAG
jgi:hypothetical protein